MMLGHGEVDGVRILSRRSVDPMTRDHMTEAQHGERFSGMNAWRDTGFGFGGLGDHPADDARSLGGLFLLGRPQRGALDRRLPGRP